MILRQLLCLEKNKIKFVFNDLMFNFADKKIPTVSLIIYVLFTQFFLCCCSKVSPFFIRERYNPGIWQIKCHQIVVFDCVLVMYNLKFKLNKMLKKNIENVSRRWSMKKDLIHSKCLSFQFVELSIFSALENDIAKAKKHFQITHTQKKKKKLTKDMLRALLCAQEQR